MNEPPNVGRHVRELRLKQGLSLRALAEQCTLSPNTISLIERGASSPSVSTLHRLATAMGVPITFFLEERAEKVETIVTRSAERAPFGSASVQLESLGAGLDGQTLEPFLVRLEPGAGSGRQEMVHQGHELVYVVQGEVEYEVSGRHHRLATGDSLLFEAALSHRWRNPGPVPAVFLLILEASLSGKTVEQHLQP
jgi:transcriptional regulator with XRE-family HTH domain